MPSETIWPDILLPKECERGVWSRGAEQGKRVPAGIDPRPTGLRPHPNDRRVSSAAPMESQDAADVSDVHRGFICASFNQDTT